MKINQHYLQLEKSYLFTMIGKKVAAFQEQHPDVNIIRLGIGDVTLPLCPAVIQALESASREMGADETFRGYGPEQGYDFLKGKIAGYYAERNVTLEEDEIFVSDGAKSYLGNILDLFDADNSVLIPDPVYPVYVDTNIMAGRRIVFANADASNGFLPLPDEKTDADIIYICSPNNPTGAVYDHAGLKAWVDYAKKRDAVILFDAAYESFVADPTLPRSIYEVEGAKEVAIEFCSFSKTAGFTGMRCGYTVIRKELVIDGVQVSKLWQRRQGCKFNGTSYITQRAAAAVFTAEGQKQIRETIAYYQNNAKVMMDAFQKMGVWFTGGTNSPYIWLKCPDGMGSWEYFDYLLHNAEIVGTPGEGFGKNGEGYFRLTAFGDAQKTVEAMERIQGLKK